MKVNTIFKRAYNDSLEMIAHKNIGDNLGSETSISSQLNVSRTTVRLILDALSEKGYLKIAGKRKIILQHPDESEAFPLEETESIESLVERKFMEWTLRGDCRAGQQVNGLDLARQFGVSQSAVREYLNKFANFGFIKKNRSGGWVFLGFNPKFAEELCDIREIFELRSAERFCAIPPEDPAWRRLSQIEKMHIDLLSKIDERYCDFSALDERFHSLIYGASDNRFIEKFHENMRIIFHYHYLWNKEDEKERNIVAIQEHLTYIATLKSRDRGACLNSAKAHMKTVRATMLNSISIA